MVGGRDREMITGYCLYTILEQSPASRHHHRLYRSHHQTHHQRRDCLRDHYQNKQHQIILMSVDLTCHINIYPI